MSGIGIRRTAKLSAEISGGGCYCLCTIDLCYALIGLYSADVGLFVIWQFSVINSGSDAATCAVIVAVSPLSTVKDWRGVMTITSLWGLLGSRFRLGMLAYFLSNPILIGLLYGGLHA
ncbi:hypothetical protein CXF72_08240 [Psychromonas sp. MB-3u-54]|nr:hypothetical protein CXF72_08240 [Psychromonas sp. MB-3u-54]